MPLAFVLSGGASLGASQAGMLDALYERGVRPDLLVGTSVGAINAAFIASRPPTVQSARELQQVWRRLSRGQIFPANPLAAGLGLLGMRNHSVPVGSLRRLLSTHVEIELLEDAPVALHVVAADVLSGEEVLLSNGPAVDAILASSAIPGVFPAVPWEAQMLMDGGILNNTPISHAVALGADRIIVLPAIGSERLTQAPRGAFGAGVAALSRAINQRFANDLVHYADAAELIVLPSPDGGILPADFGHAEELIAEGLERAEAMLARRMQSVALRLAA
ncbi:MAG TPA: patatin-like phospholipase family protein [Solirubrobacteraceae bacterium]|nr:patatin-like phospholipase family protein [Solirubrobacteraceae bacterium]